MQKIFSLDYTESLRIPEGFRVEQIVATTYSLELEMVYLLMTLTEEVTEKVFWDELALRKCLAAYEKNKQRITVFYQNDKLYCKGGKLDSDFLKLVDICCIPVEKGDYAFHPKVIFAEYQNKEGKILQRLIVSSRNLTQATFAECAVVLEREATSPAGNFCELLSFIEFVNHSQWYHGDEKAEVYFQDGNIRLQELMELTNETKKTIVSPFYTGGDFCSKIKNAEFYRGDTIHGKVYLFEEEDKNILWVGSANCTQNGLNNNYECIVKIETALEAEDLKDWVIQHGGERINPKNLPANSENDSTEKQIEKFIQSNSFFLHLTKSGKDKYKCRIEIRSKKELENIASDMRLEIGIQGVFPLKVFGEQELVWELKKTNISAYGLIGYERENGKKAFRMIKMDADNTILESIRKENINDIVQKKMEDIFPAFILEENMAAELEEDINEDDMDSRNETNPVTGVMVANDGIYEKVVKMYALGREGDAIIQSIRAQIKSNEEFYGIDGTRFLQWTKWMVKEES